MKLDGWAVIVHDADGDVWVVGAWDDIDQARRELEAVARRLTPDGDEASTPVLPLKDDRGIEASWWSHPSGADAWLEPLNHDVGP